MKKSKIPKSYQNIDIGKLFLEKYNFQCNWIFTFMHTATESVRRLSDQFSQVQDHILLTLRAEATFSWYKLACKKQPLPTTVQFSIVHAQNSSRDSQATGSSNLCEFRGNQTCKNYLRTTLLELLFCFSASPPLVLSIFSRKISTDRLCKESIFKLSTVGSPVCFVGCTV